MNSDASMPGSNRIVVDIYINRGKPRSTKIKSGQ